MTYRSFFGDSEKNYGNLMDINPRQLPDFDVMVAGFPCQTFSVIGKRGGMEDDRGQIIYGLLKIMKAKNLPYFILENVKGLVNHNGGRTLKTILEELRNAGYKVYHKVLNSLDFGVPQMRERIYFIGIKNDLVKSKQDFEWPMPKKTPEISRYLIDNTSMEFDKKSAIFQSFERFINNKYNRDQYNSNNLLGRDYLVLDTRQSDLRLYKNRVPTLRTGRHGLLYVKNGRFKQLSGFESLLLQGFPRELALKVRDKIPNLYLLSQAGNAMTVNVIEEIGRSLLNYIKINEKN